MPISKRLDGRTNKDEITRQSAKKRTARPPKPPVERLRQKKRSNVNEYNPGTPNIKKTRSNDDTTTHSCSKLDNKSTFSYLPKEKGVPLKSIRGNKSVQGKPTSFIEQDRTSCKPIRKSQHSDKEQDSDPDEIEENEFAEATNNKVLDVIEMRKRNSNNKMVNISLEKYNSIKSELEYVRGISRQLSSTVQLWQEKCDQLTKENEKLRLTAQFNELDSASTALLSASSSTKDSSVTKRIRSAAKKASLLEEIKQHDIPMEISTLLNQLHTDMHIYAHQYTSEVCLSESSLLTSSIPWAPNMFEEKEDYVKDWRGRCIVDDNVEDKSISSNMTHSSGAPLLNVIKDTDDRLVVDALCFPLCPMEQALSGTMFSTSLEAENNFIGQAALTLLTFKTNSEPSSELAEKIYNFSSKSVHLLTRFQHSCRQSISNKKNKAKDVYFSFLGYDSINIGIKKGLSRSAIEELESKKNLHMTTAYKKLYKTLEDGTRDTTFWRMANFSEICSNDVQELELRDVEGTDELFFNEPARLAYSAFQKFDLGCDADASISTLIRVDAFMTSIIDSFKSSSEALQNSKPQNSVDNTEDDEGEINNVNQKDGRDKSIDSKENKSANDSGKLSQNSAVKYSETTRAARKKNKGGTVPMEATKRLRSLLPIAAAQLLNQALNIFKHKLSSNHRKLKFELSIGIENLVTAKLRNSRRSFTVAFKHPQNSKIYIALNSNAFSDLICCWIGRITDCYILQADSFNREFKSFSHSNPYEIFHESDGEGVSEEGNEFAKTTAHISYETDDDGVVE